MKKRIICLLLAVFMIVGMIPLTAISAFAASGWQTGEVHGQYGYVKSGNEAER